jgi:uncharacterized protein
MIISSILWHRLDQPGHDAARLEEQGGGYRIEGTAVFGEGEHPCRLDYRVTCDARWHTRSATVCGWMGATAIDWLVAVDDARGWTFNGLACPAVAGCEDVDLSFTPATNLLPIRRLALPVGVRTNVRAAWLRFPEGVLEPLEQSYSRVAERQYAYESSGGTFRTLLDTNDVGMVTDYHGLWRRVGS